MPLVKCKPSRIAHPFTISQSVLEIELWIPQTAETGFSKIRGAAGASRNHCSTTTFLSRKTFLHLIQCCGHNSMLWLSLRLKLTWNFFIPFCKFYQSTLKKIIKPVKFWLKWAKTNDLMICAQSSSCCWRFVRCNKPKQILVFKKSVWKWWCTPNFLVILVDENWKCL